MNRSSPSLRRGDSTDLFDSLSSSVHITITLVNSSKQQLVSVQSWWKLVFTVQPTLMYPRMRISLMSPSSFSQLCPAYLALLSWMLSETGSKWPYCCCFVRCCFQDMIKAMRSILMKFPLINKERKRKLERFMELYLKLGLSYLHFL